MKPKLNLITFAIRVFGSVLPVTYGLFLIGMSSCGEIFEKDLSSNMIELVSPGDSLHSTSQVQTFWWEKVDGALEYNLQIGSPTFGAMEKLILDTSVTENLIQFALYPGQFQWRVKAMNYSSSTDYSYRILFVDSTMSLNGQQIILKTPENQLATQDSSITFEWYEVYNASDYRFEVHSFSWTGDLVQPPQITEHSTLSISLPEGIYVWGVQGQNEISSTPFSTRTLIIDSTPPGIPTLSFPANNSGIHDSTLTNSTLAFNWTRGFNSSIGSTVNDSIFIYTDSVLVSSNIFAEAFIADTLFSVELSLEGTYFWRVRSYDKAGNCSNYSSLWKFSYEK